MSANRGRSFTANILSPFSGLEALVNIACSLATVALMYSPMLRLHFFLSFSEKLINNISDFAIVTVSVAYFFLYIYKIEALSFEDGSIKRKITEIP